MNKMKNKSLFKFIAIFILAISLATIPTIDFLSYLEPAIAVTKKKKVPKRKTQSEKQAATRILLHTDVVIGGSREQTLD